jgi:hypothetical protein
MWPADADGITDDVDIWTGALRPFQTPLMLTALLDQTLAFAMIITSVAHLMTSRVRAKPVLFRLLLVGAVLSTVTLAATLTPAGQSISSWILD